MEESRPDRIWVNLAGEIVDISRRDRDALLQELAMTAGHHALREKFEAAGEHRPVQLGRGDMSDLRTTIETWKRDGLPPDGLAPLLAALVRTDRSS